MQYSKVIASILVAVMVITPAAMFSATDAETEDSTDTCDTGTVNVYLYTDSNTYKMKTVCAFDLYQAVVAASSSLGITIEAAEVYDDITDVTYDGSQWIYDFGSYTDINPYYGEIDSITYENTTYTSNSNDSNPSFRIYVSDGTQNSWTAAEDAIGWYRPFADYASTVTFDGTKSAGASNIAIVLSDSVSVNTLNSLDDLQKLTDVDRDDAAYRYTFFLRDATGTVDVPPGTTVTTYVEGFGDVTTTLSSSDLVSGITIVGYGSDAYQALRNALGDNLSGQIITVVEHVEEYYTYYTYYSWMESIFGSGTETIYNSDGTTTYIYWSSYTNEAQPGYLSYTFGYYSSLEGAPNAGSDFILVYEESTY